MSAPIARRPPLRYFPLKPHHLHDRRTPTDLVFYIAPLGMPASDEGAWQLAVDGMVERPTSYTFQEIKALPRRKVEAMHQCAGNPATWDKPTRRITNVEWTGVPLYDLLAEAGLMKDATFLWSYGRDSGVYNGTGVEEYIKDTPLDEIKASGALLAYEMNGEALRPEHGYPLRVVVPGYYGTNSVKWLKRLRLEDRRSDSYFTTTLYNDPLPDGGSKPVWAIAPESVIVSPSPNADLDLEAIQIHGWAWSRDAIVKVEVSTDGGVSWFNAQVEHRIERTWQRFRYIWRPDVTEEATAVLMSRATDASGETQPTSGARNAIHSVPTRLIREGAR